MKAITLLIIALFLLPGVQAQVSRTVELTAGSLNTELSGEELQSITDLTISGTLNARDFRTMRDSMPVLAVVDMGQADITPYEGMDGTNNWGNMYDSYGRFFENEIPVGAFSNKASLQTIVFPESCTVIESSAFSFCTGLSGELTLPEGLLKIGSVAFYSCTSLSGELVIPPQVTVLENGIFALCSGITSLVLPPSVRHIVSGAFYGWSSLQLIEARMLWPVLITEKQQVFEGVDLADCELRVPYGTRERYAQAPVWKEFTRITEAESGFLVSASTLRFAREGGTDTVAIAANVQWDAVSDREWLSVSPSSGSSGQALIVTVEANSAVSAREGTLLFTSEGQEPQSLKVMQEAVVTTVDITPGGLREALSHEELQTVSSLTLSGSMDARDFNTIRFQMPLLEILDIREATIEAFTDTTHGNSILYPEDALPFAIHEWNDKAQTAYALSEHERLRVIRLPRTLKNIGYRAFFACTALTTVEMPSSVEKIGEEAFYICSALSAINLPLSLTSISASAFQGCISLVSVELPASLKEIEYETFADCRGLTSVVIPSSITSIAGYAFMGCISLESLNLPPSLPVIDHKSFMDCSSLTRVVIPHGVTGIAESAFQGGSELLSVILPATLTGMGASAFADCTRLDTITCYAADPPNLDNDGLNWVFDKVDKENCLLLVPYGSKERYAEAYEWEDFDNIREMERFALEDTAVSLDAGDQSEAEVMLHSPQAWTATANEQWLTVDPASGSGSGLLTLTAIANPGDTSRTALVVIHAEGMDSLVLTVTQRGIPVGIGAMGTRAQLSFYPNPFTTQMSIEAANPSLKEITIEIYSISGQKIKTLARAQKGQRISLVWKGEDEQGRQVPKGMYLVKVNGEGRKVVKE